MRTKQAVLNNRERRVEHEWRSEDHGDCIKQLDSDSQAILRR